VATFYSQFRLKPTGRNRITACCGTACHVRGAERILGSIKRELHLGEEEDTTADAQFTVREGRLPGILQLRAGRARQRLGPRQDDRRSRPERDRALRKQ